MIARNAMCWAIVSKRSGMLHIRKIVWGRLMARMEKRPEEKVVRATILLGTALEKQS